jgi:2-C-methyl-D-erythritol 4-phosphate cytidylyltransferase
VIWTIVLAAGQGTRFGDRAKQFERLGDRSLVSWSVGTAAESSDGVVLVVPPGREAADEASHAVAGAPLVVVDGGATRSESVRCGLAGVPQGAEVIVVHDAARPLAPPSLFRAVVDAVRAGADAAVPGLAVADTIKEVRAGVVVGTLDRASLVAVQTPQAFRAPILRRAHDAGGDATDDATLIERLGGQVVVVEGDPRALKVTVLDDLARVEAML